MAGAIGVGSHFQTEFYLVTAEIIRNSFAGETAVAVDAYAFEFYVSAVEIKSAVAAETDGAETEFLFVRIKCPAVFI